MGWVANVACLIGLVAIGRHRASGFAWTFLGETMWAFHGYRNGQYDLAAICCLFAVIAFYNWLDWSTADAHPPPKDSGQRL